MINDLQHDAASTTPVPTPSVASPSLWRIPALDVLHRDGSYQLLIDVPGVRPEGVVLVVEDGALVLTAQRADHPDLGYKRRLALSDAIDHDAIDARLADGVLTVTLRPRAVVSHTVPVRVA